MSGGFSFWVNGTTSDTVDFGDINWRGIAAEGKKQVIDFGQSTPQGQQVAKGFGQVQTVRAKLLEARAAYDEFEAKTDAEKQAARAELVKGLKKDGTELGFKMLDAWDPSLEVHQKFSVQVLNDDQSVFGSLEGDFRFQTALDKDAQGNSTRFISLSVTGLDAYMQVGDPAGVSVKVGVKDGAVALRLNSDKTYALMAEGTDWKLLCENEEKTENQTFKPKTHQAVCKNGCGCTFGMVCLRLRVSARLYVCACACVCVCRGAFA